MPENPLIFKDAEKVRDEITERQLGEILNLYNSWADDIGNMAEKYALKTNKSAPVSEMYYKELQKQIQETSRILTNELYTNLKQGMYTVADAVVASNVNWLKQFGFDEKGLNAAFSYVPDSVVRSIATGQVYESGWSLSKRIWGYNEQILKELYQITAGGVAKQMPIYEIAKQLEQYVRPGAAKQWNLTDKDGRKIYPRQVDYNAQRLARTLVQHSYQQSFVAVTAKNPFVIDYIWIANGSRVCELCAARDGQHYKKDELPLDHPNGMCVMQPNISDTMEDDLVKWFNSEDGTYPEIDEFAKQFGYDASKYEKSTPEFNNTYQRELLAPGGFTPDNMPKDFVEWLETMEYKLIERAEEVAKDMGLDLESFYDKYIGNPNAPTRLTREWIEANIYKETMTSDSKLIPAYIEEIINALNKDSVSDAYRRAFAQAMSKMSNWTSTEEGSYFRRSSNTINITMDSIRASTTSIGPRNMQNGFHVVFHEMGHSIDATNAEWKKDIYSQQSSFQRVMMNDIKNLQGKLKIGKITEADLNKLREDGNSRGVQDILGACRYIDDGAYKQIGEILYTYGHSGAYWQRSDPKAEAASELFANISAAQVSPAEMEYINKFFPQSKREFDKIIEKVAKQYVE